MQKKLKTKTKSTTKNEVQTIETLLFSRSSNVLETGEMTADIARLALDQLVDFLHALAGVDDHNGRGPVALVLGGGVWRRSAEKPRVVQVVQTLQIVDVYAGDLLLATALLQTLHAHVGLDAQVEHDVELTRVVARHPLEPLVQYVRLDGMQQATVCCCCCC